MTYHEYLTACLKFAKDTKDRLAIDMYSFYSVVDTGWKKTVDNACNGILCDWAFHKDDDFIKKYAKKEFYNQLINELEIAYDEDWDKKQFRTIVEKYT